jgi:hypothetical protein
MHTYMRAGTHTYIHAKQQTEEETTVADVFHFPAIVALACSADEAGAKKEREREREALQKEEAEAGRFFIERKRAGIGREIRGQRRGDWGRWRSKAERNRGGEAMSAVNVTNVSVLDNPSMFLNPFQFEIAYECLVPLSDGQSCFFRTLILLSMF